MLVGMTKEDVLEKLKELRPLLEAEGVQHLAVFGSRARGDHRDDSDLDIAIEVDSNTKFSVLNLIGVEHIVHDATGLTANAFMRRSMNEGISKNAALEAIEIF